MILLISLLTALKSYQQHFVTFSFSVIHFWLIISSQIILTPGVQYWKGVLVSQKQLSESLLFDSLVFNLSLY